MWLRSLQAATLVILAGCASDNAFSRLTRRNTDTPPPLYAKDGDPAQPARKPLLAALSREDGTITETLKSAEEAEDAGRMTEARGLYERVLTYKPDHPRAHHRLATIADRESRFGDAERHYQSALKTRPKDADVLSDLGYSYQLQGRFAESEQRLSAALRFNPKHRQALFNLGNLYAMHGRDEDALSLYRKAGSEAEAQAALAHAKQTDPAVQMASHQQGASRNVLSSAVDKTTNPARTYPNAATRKLAEEMERRRAEYDRNEAARGRPVRPSAENYAGYGAPPESGGRYSSEEMRARFEQIDQQFDGAGNNPPPIYVGPPQGTVPQGAVGYRGPNSHDPQAETATSAGAISPAAGYGIVSPSNPPARSSGFGNPAGEPAGQAAWGYESQGAQLPAAPAYGQGPQSTGAAPAWAGQSATGPAAGNVTPNTSRMTAPPHQAAQRAAQMGLGAGQGNLSFDDSPEVAPANGTSMSAGTYAPTNFNSPRPTNAPTPMGLGTTSPSSVEEAELQTLQQQMQQLQQRQWQLQQRMQSPAAPQIRPGVSQ